MSMDDQEIESASEDSQGDPADEGGGGFGGLLQGVLQHLGNSDPADTEANVTDQAANLPPGQADDLAGSLLNLAERQGVDVNGLLGQLGIDESQAGSYLGPLMGLLHQNHPEALGQAAAQDEGLAGLLGNPSVGGILGSLAGKLFGR